MNGHVSDQDRKSTIRDVFRDVDTLEQMLTSMLDTMRSLRQDEDKMDWERAG